MRDLVEIRDSLTDYKTWFNNVTSGFQDVETQFNSINTLLSDKDKWSGDTRDKCENIQRLVKSYADSIAPICSELETCIMQLENDTDSFMSESDGVKKLNSL